MAVNYYRNPEIADTLVDEIKDIHKVESAAVPGSVTNHSDISNMFERTEKELAPVDILINNAAVCPSSFVKDTTGEIADVVVFLASERASYITGTTVNVSGGMLMC